MKWFVCLFSFYVLFLSGVPCAAAGDCCMDEISTSQSPQKDSQEQHKPICPCSPFFACGACHGALPSKIEIQFSRIQVQEKKLHVIYSENELFDFPPIIWQPPRIG